MTQNSMIVRSTIDDNNDIENQNTQAQRKFKLHLNNKKAKTKG